MGRQGISSRALSRQGNPLGTVTFKFRALCVAGTSSYTLVNKAPYKLKVIGVQGIMTGAGAGGDTVKLTDGTNDITDAVDLSAKSDKVIFSVGTIDDAHSTILKGESLKAVTASDATCEIWVECARID